MCVERRGENKSEYIIYSCVEGSSRIFDGETPIINWQISLREKVDKKSRHHKQGGRPTRTGHSLVDTYFEFDIWALAPWSLSLQTLSRLVDLYCL